MHLFFLASGRCSVKSYLYRPAFESSERLGPICIYLFENNGIVSRYLQTCDTAQNRDQYLNKLKTYFPRIDWIRRSEMQQAWFFNLILSLSIKRTAFHLCRQFSQLQLFVLIFTDFFLLVYHLSFGLTISRYFSPLALPFFL